MRKEFFLGNPRLRRASRVWVDDWPEADDIGLYNAPRVFWGRRYDFQYFTPEFAIKLGRALVQAGERARQLEENREKRGRKYTRYRIKAAS